MISNEMRSALPGVFREISLARYTTWGVGGLCTAAFARSPEELQEAIGFIREENIKWTILGRGSNTLAPSEGWDGIAVILTGEFTGYRFRENLLHAGAGAPLPSMAGAACSGGLSGLAFAVGIPGSLGGALFMNAGAYGSSMSDVVKEITVLSEAGVYESFSSEQSRFGYRSSAFQTCRCVITGAVLELTAIPGGVEELKAEARGILSMRREKFPLNMPNAGSVFKRPENGPPPGKLIEECGLKGHRTGGARVSPVHANFIENTGGATSCDILKLITLVQDRVEAQSGIRLVKEIEVLGDSE